MMTTPDKDSAVCQKRARFAKGDEQTLHAKIRGIEDDSTAHEVTRYIWWSKHEGSSVQCDSRFATKRQALLYCAKKNSEALVAVAKEMKSEWGKLFATEGAYSIEPSQPFELDMFIELSDAQLEAWSNDVCNAFSRHKTPNGTSYRYAPRDSEIISDHQLLQILKHDSSSTVMEHVHRQKLLLSDIAGFD